MEQKVIIKMIKRDKEDQLEISTETYLEKIKKKWENMRKTATIICLTKKKKEYQKNYCEAKKPQYNNE